MPWRICAVASSVAPPCWCRKTAESRLLAVDDVEITELLDRYTGLLESRSDANSFRMRT